MSKKVIKILKEFLKCMKKGKKVLFSMTLSDKDPCYYATVINGKKSYCLNLRCHYDSYCCIKLYYLPCKTDEWQVIVEKHIYLNNEDSDINVDKEDTEYSKIAKKLSKLFAEKCGTLSDYYSSIMNEVLDVLKKINKEKEK